MVLSMPTAVVSLGLDTYYAIGIYANLAVDTVVTTQLLVSTTNESIPSKLRQLLLLIFPIDNFFHRTTS